MRSPRVLLALADGLMLHGTFDPGAFAGTTCGSRFRRTRGLD